VDHSLQEILCEGMDEQDYAFREYNIKQVCLQLLIYSFFLLMVYMIPCINCIRVESAHWSLKKVLGSSLRDLSSCWDGIHNVIILQHSEIKVSFERSLNLMSDSYKVLSYKRLVGYVSRSALELLVLDLERVKKIGFDTSRCGYILRQTYGLPCACELARYDLG